MAETADCRNTTVSVYSLGQVEFDAVLAMQRRLVYEISGERDRAALIMCEHLPLISVGRQGSSADIHLDRNELRHRGWPVKWVNRGGGAMLHIPGQIAIYSILALDRLGLDLGGYLNNLRSVLHDVALDTGAQGAAIAPAGVQVGGRLLAHVGVAVRDWVSYFGAVINVNPDLDLFRRVDCAGSVGPMTSIERERRLIADPAFVRQCLVERFLERFDLSRTGVIHEQPDFAADAIAAGPLSSPEINDLQPELTRAQSPEF